MTLDDSKLLAKVKATLLITGTFHDEMIKNYIDEVRNFLKDAGVSLDILSRDAVIGVISKGVSDLWTQGKLSDYFYQRATQLSFEGDCYE